MTVDAALMKKLKDNAHSAHDQYVEAVLEVICACIKDMGGEYPSDRFRERLYDAIRFDI